MSWNVQLVGEWRQCWRWFSMHAMVMSLAIEGATASIPDNLAEYLPGKLMHILAVIVLMLGIGGRLIKQGDKNVQSH